jgi:carboxyl-terminal processing protease
MFLSGDTIVHVRGKNADHDQTLKANKGSLVPSTMPLVTLVNKGSASASEILAGALQDNKRSPLIGSQTFGKGLIQIVSPFGDGYYTLTTSQYKTPSGAEIHTVGIPVDIEVDDVYIADDEMEAYLEFTNSGVVEEFVAEHPGFSFENVQLFLDSVVGEDPPFGKEVYRLLVRREYLNAIPYEERPIADVEFDPVLKEAIEYLNRSF